MDDLCDACSNPYTEDFLAICDICRKYICHWCYNNHGCDTDGYVGDYDEGDEEEYSLK